MTNPMEDEEIEANIIRTPRWMAATVMMAACIGFVGLAYYAYNAGTRAMRDEDLVTVEADNAPVKEKPANPGGMQFPDQDKTIFQAASGNAKPATVERVLPGPEAAVNREQLASAQNAPNANSQAWINNKLNNANNTGPDALIEKSAPAPVVVAQNAPVPPSTPVAPAKPLSQAAAAVQAASNMAPAAGEPAAAPVIVATPPVAAAPAPVAESNTVPEVSVQQPKPAVQPAPPAESPKVELKKEEPVAQEEAEKPAAAETAAKKKSAGGKPGLIQLGAFRSEEEAQHAWKKMHGKYHDLKTLTPDIEKADLGEKGTYYRLRVKAPNAKTLCHSLVGKGLSCIVVK